MSDSTSSWSLRILAAHSPRWDQSLRQQFCNGVCSVVSDVETKRRNDHPSLRLRPHITVAGRQDQELTDLRSAFAFAMLDVTDYDEEVAFIAGQIQGARIPYVFLRRTNSDAVIPPRILSDAHIVPYDTITNLFLGDSVLSMEISRAISQVRVLEELVYELWFPRDVSRLWIVCPQVHDPSEFANRSSPDYTYLDNLGDTDALLEIMVFLCRYYPNASIRECSSIDLASDHTREHLVVIGGPGCADDISNHLCHEMMKSVQSRISYPTECDRMLVALGSGEIRELRPELRSDVPDVTRNDFFSVRRDYGYFARFPNPLNEAARVVLVNGVHTAGVRGAAKAFADSKGALRNYHSVFNSSANSSGFECYFEVTVLNGEPRVPDILPDNIYSLGSDSPTIRPARKAVEMTAPVDDKKRPVTVLLVAGDRGSSQQYLIQFPREVDAIQEALKGSKYRSSFNLATPIQAATVQKLTTGYADRPSIMHFAGHGNDRSLSFISDQGLVVIPAEVLTTQLSTILGNYPKRVDLCVFNTCSSQAIAKHLVDDHVVTAAVGWPAKLADDTAIRFSQIFYRCLGDGVPLSNAVSLAATGCGAVEHPVLYTIPEVDSNALTFAQDTEI